jgi:1,2-diacylglycerol 3-alpha-glucosyltransferase
MKVALFNESFPPQIDGVANCVVNYAQYLSKNHCETMVITPNFPGADDGKYNFPVYRYPSFDMGKRLGYRVGNFLDPKVLRFLNKQNFDLMHIHSPFASSVIVALSLLGRRKVPVVVTYHTKFDYDIRKRIPTKPMQNVAIKFLLHNLNKADEVWVPTDASAQSLREIGYEKPYKVMENGTDFSKGKADASVQRELINKCETEKADFVFLFVGRMMWYKNVKLILDSLALCPEINFKMIFVGDGADRADIEKYTAEIGLSQKTKFVGAVSDRELVRGYFSIADLFLFPSVYDTSGLVVKEAAACSLASLLVRCSCAAEGVIDNDNGFLCEENAEDMARVIKEACADRKKMEYVGKNAEQTVYLSWEDAVARAYSRYEKILNDFKEKQK